MQQNHYIELDVSPQASLDEIRTAYRRQVRQWHPDVNSGPRAEEKTKRIIRAYEVLSDSMSRSIFDVELGEEAKEEIESYSRKVDVHVDCSATVSTRHYRGVYSEAKRKHERRTNEE